MLQQGLFNAGMVTATRGFAVVSALPEAYLALVNAKCCTKGALAQSCQYTGGAELTSCDEVLAVSSHDNLHSFGDVSRATAKLAIKKRIKCRPDSLAVISTVRVKQALPDQSRYLGIPDLQRQATQPCKLAGSVEAHARHRWRSCCDGGGHSQDR